MLFFVRLGLGVTSDLLAPYLSKGQKPCLSTRPRQASPMKLLKRLLTECEKVLNDSDQRKNRSIYHKYFSNPNLLNIF